MLSPARVKVPDGRALIARGARNATRLDVRSPLLLRPELERHAAVRNSPKGRVLGAYCRQRTQVFVARLPPLGNQVLVTQLSFHQVVVQLSRNGFLLVVKLVDETVSFPVYSGDSPGCFALPLSLVCLIYGLAHPLFKL